MRRQSLPTSSPAVPSRCSASSSSFVPPPPQHTTQHRVASSAFAAILEFVEFFRQLKKETQESNRNTVIRHAPAIRNPRIAAMLMNPPIRTVPNSPNGTMESSLLPLFEMEESVFKALAEDQKLAEDEQLSELLQNQLKVSLEQSTKENVTELAIPSATESLKKLQDEVVFYAKGIIELKKQCELQKADQKEQKNQEITSRRDQLSVLKTTEAKQKQQKVLSEKFKQAEQNLKSQLVSTKAKLTELQQNQQQLTSSINQVNCSSTTSENSEDVTPAGDLSDGDGPSKRARINSTPTPVASSTASQSTSLGSWSSAMDSYPTRSSSPLVTSPDELSSPHSSPSPSPSAAAQQQQQRLWDQFRDQSGPIK